MMQFVELRTLNFQESNKPANLLGFLTPSPSPAFLEESVCVEDIQTSISAYSAELLESIDGRKAILLDGNGWAEKGFPVYLLDVPIEATSHDIMYGDFTGGYPLITSQRAVDAFVKSMEEQKLPEFSELGISLSELSIYDEVSL